jgi:ABC-type glycerol-3-phosphate transport system substrate-binding protein
VFQATLAPVDINIFEGIAYANGGRFLDEETETIMINGPGFVDALQLIVDMVNDGSTPASLTDIIFKDAAALFAERKAMMWGGMSWLIRPWYPEDPEDLRWVGVPFPRPDTVTGKYEAAATIMDPTAALMIPSTSKNPEAALKYLDFWAQPERLILWDGDPVASRVPATAAAYQAESLKQVWPQWVEAFEQGTLFEGSLPMPRFNGRAECEQYLGKAIQEAILGQKTPQEALDDAAQQAQELYDLLNK